MKLSKIGELTNNFLIEIPQRYEYAILDEYIVMPNHVHAIVIIDKIDDGTDSKFPIKPQGEQTTPKKPGGITGNKNPMLHDNISRIFNWFTGRVTFESRKIDKNFAWQSRFNDHIIRNNESHQRIRNYIINNPQKWDKDDLYND